MTERPGGFNPEKPLPCVSLHVVKRTDTFRKAPFPLAPPFTGRMWNPEPTDRPDFLVRPLLMEEAGGASIQAR